jgi:hypothetical protein
MLIEIKKQLVHLLSEDSFLLINGSTDSEHFFSLFVDKYKEAMKGDHTNPIVEALKVCKSLGIGSHHYQNAIKHLLEICAPYLSETCEIALNIGRMH